MRRYRQKARGKLRVHTFIKQIGGFFGNIITKVRSWTWNDWKKKGIQAIVVIIILLPLYAAYLWFTLPDVSDPTSLIAAQSSIITDRNGTELYRLYEGQDRTYVNGEEIPQAMKDAIIAIEDERFYERGCLDFRALARVVFRFGQSGGASTITRQLARNALDLHGENIINRKLKELILGCQLERLYTKDKLLELYLNWIPFGRNAYGIEQASARYFSKSATEITLPEATILASLPQRPSYFSPYGYHVFTDVSDTALLHILQGKITELDDLEDEDIRVGLIGANIGTGSTTLYIGGRTDQVLKNMQSLGFITEGEKLQALDELQSITFESQRETIRAPHFVLWVRDIVEEMIGEAEEGILAQGGLQIETTLDWDLQEQAENIITERKEDFSERFSAHNTALISADPRTGEILAYVGNTDYGDDEYDGKVDMVRAPRQPGSTFKPIVYSAFFNAGYGPGTILYDTETEFGTETPQNFDGLFWGRISARQALAASRNVPAIKAFFLSAEGNQEDRILDLVSALGAPTPKEKKLEYKQTNPDFGYGYPLAIGSAETPLLEMAQVYATFANEGKSAPFFAIRRILDRNGNILYRAPLTEETRVLDPRIAYQVTSVLSDISARPNDYWKSILSVPGWQAAAKTGTSNKCLERYESGSLKGQCKDRKPSDLWTIGYTPEIVTGVWVGNTKGEGLSSAAESLISAAPIWHDFMVSAHRERGGSVNFNMPDGIVQPLISLLSGQLPTECTPVEQRKPDVFLEEYAPNLPDPACLTLSVDKLTGLLSSPACPAEAQEEGNFFLPSSIRGDRWPLWEQSVQEWAKEQMEIWNATPNHSGSLLPLPLAPTEQCDPSLTPGRLEKPELRITFPTANNAATYPSFKPRIDYSVGSSVREIQIEIDGRRVPSLSGATITPISVPRSVGKSGTHTLKMTLIDRYFNQATDEVQFSFQDDKVAPIVRLTSPRDGSVIISGETINLTATAVDREGGLKYVQFYLNGRLLTTKPSEPYALEYNADIKPGTYTLKVVATDLAENEAEDEVRITVTP